MPKVIIHNYLPARANDGLANDDNLPPGIKRDPSSGEFTAGGRSASQHERAGEHHLKVGKASEARHEAKGERSKRLGSRSASWYKGQQHQLAGSHHVQAAEHLRASPPRLKEAVESARLAEHHKPETSPHTWEPGHAAHKEKRANLRKALGLGEHTHSWLH